MPEVIVINVVVGDRTYRLKVNQNDEEVVRKTVKKINDQIVFFKTNFAGKDMQDYIAMAILWFATEQTKAGELMVKEEETSSRINSLNDLLDKILGEGDLEKKEE